MPHYLLSVHHGDGDVLPDGVDPQSVFAAVEAFNSRLEADGVLVYAGGLQPASTARTAHRDGEVTEGPRLSGEEYMGGFWVVQAADDAAAMELAKAAVATGCSWAVEVRPFQTA